MPAWVTDEGRWKKAKAAAAKSKGKSVGDLHDDDFRLVNYLYHKMGKTEEDMVKAEYFKQMMLSESKQSIINPSLQISTKTAVKMPKSKKMPDAFGKPSLFFKNDDRSNYRFHPTLRKLKDFLCRAKHKK